jgi:hypothetical protein
MDQVKLWPPPGWQECVISWDWLLEDHDRPHVNEIYSWCDQHVSPGRYHVHGWHSTGGFAFRFEDPKDAVLFKLTWICE